MSTNGIRKIAGLVNNYPVENSLSGTAVWNTEYRLEDISSLSFTVPAYVDTECEIRILFSAAKSFSASINTSNFTTAYGFENISVSSYDKYILSIIPLSSSIVVCSYVSWEGKYPVPTEGLMAEYLFEGDCKDTSGNSIDGTVVNASYGVGISGSCLNYTGTNSYFVTDNNYSTMKSISFWFNATQANGGCIIALGHTSNHYAVFSVWIDSSSRIQVNFAGYATRRDTPAVSLNNWHHVVITNDSVTAGATNLKVYVDGSQVTLTSESSSTSYTAGTGRSAFGGFFDNSNVPTRLFYIGEIDNLRMYNRILTADEVTVLYGEGNQKLPTGYTKLNYLQSSGTQYINLGFPLRADYTVDIGFQYTSLGNKYICGGFYDTIDGKVCRNEVGIYNSFFYVFGASGSLGRLSSTSNTNMHKIKVHWGSTNMEVWLDGVSNSTWTYSGYDPTIAPDSSTGYQYLFARNYSSSPQGMSGKIFYYKCVNGDGDYIRDLVPALNSSNVPGMYDLANDVFYTNAGSGSFTYG